MIVGMPLFSKTEEAEATRPRKEIVLRPYQEGAIEELRASIAAGEKPVLNLPTGAGKTALAASIFKMARARGKKAAFCVPFLTLIDQTFEAFVEAGVPEDEIGVIQGNHILTNKRREVQICSVDTLVRRPKLPDSDLVIFDEVHRNSKIYGRWMAERPDVRFIGLSATPWRHGMKEQGWNRLIVAATTRQLIDDGYLSPFRFFAPSHPDLSGVKISHGDYDEAQLARVMGDHKLMADIVETWKKHGRGRPTFCFAVNCAHAEKLASSFNAAGIRAGYMDAYSEGRQATIDKLRTGELEIICSVGVLTTGVDAPFVSCLILARPTRSEMLYVQIVGRGLRRFPGKEDCIVLDHSDTALRLGLPDEIVYYDFIDKPEKKSGSSDDDDKPERLPKLCPKCAAVKPPGVHVCPECGFEPTRQSEIAPVDGQLAEIGKDRKTKAISKEEHDKASKQRFFSGLLWIAHERGYKKGWAANQYREKYGVWPRGLKEIAEYPNSVVFKHMKAKREEWKAKRAAEERAEEGKMVALAADAGEQ